MSFKDFKIIETIGKGSFASVYKVVRRSDNKMYALKRVKINKMSKKEIADALNEIRFLASIRHKNVVGFLEAFLENNETELCIVMEYCGSGDLAQKVERYKKKRQYIDEKVIWRYLIQALKALNHLHGKGICHRDLKVANTFLAEDGSIKIGDMNVSKRLDQGQLKTQIGTPYYMSPEIWNNRPYDSRSDIWSLGCMIYELAALRPPFLGDSFPALKRAVTLGRYSLLPGKYSDSLGRVISQMLKLDARSRPSADMLLKSSDVLPMLQFDETSTSFGQANPAGNQQPLALINTIKVPQHLRKLNSALPKPCYPDVRPNSPTSWTVAEQKAQQESNHQQAVLRAAAQRKAAPLPPVPALPLPSMTEVSTGIASGKENQHPIPTFRSDCSDASGKPSKGKPRPTPPSVPSAAVADYYARRPLAPAYPLHPSNRANAAPHRAAGTVETADSGAPYKVPGLGYNRPVAFKPSLNPVLGGAENAPAPPPVPPSIPAVSYERHQQYSHAPRAPQRLQYHHNRVW